MGTRNLTIVKLGDKLFGQYCQWDGYPSGQGAIVWDFIHNMFKKDEFVENFKRLKLVTPEELKRLWESAGAPPGSEFVTLDVSQKFQQLYPHLHRDCGAEILAYIQKTPEPLVKDEIEFAADSLFCEWAYMLDLDKDELRVFRGFNQTPLDDDEPFKFLESKSDGKYHPIKTLMTISFEDLKKIDNEKEFVFVVESYLPKDDEG